MSPMILFITISFAIYACLKWWFDTSITDHFLRISGYNINMQELQMILADKGKLSILIVELFQCPWCISFHLSWMMNLGAFYVHKDVYLFMGSTLASAGGGMFLWQEDLKS